MRKLLTRSLTLSTLLLLAYFVLISKDTGKVPTEPAKHGDQPVASAVSIGKDVRVRVFDREGAKVSDGTFRSVIQEDEDKIRTEDPDVTYTTSKGRLIHVRASFLEIRGSDQQVLSANPGSRILVREEGGITIQTVGPLIYDPNTMELHTDALAHFRMTNFSGQCLGLRYRSEDYLMLRRDVLFQTDEDSDGKLLVEAASMSLNLPMREGIINQGIIICRGEVGHTSLISSKAMLGFDGGLDGSAYRMTDISLMGDPARVHWGQVEVEAVLFNGCFDGTGKWVETIRASQDASFTTASADDYWFTGRSGALVLEADHGQPRLLRGEDEVVLTGKRGNGPRLFLEGNGGLETQFSRGIAASTRIFGAPHFRYADQVGQAGSLRVLHQKHQILFSGGADLYDAGQHLRIKGDEVLLANWDQSAREIFAFKFVEILRFEGTPQLVQSYGEQLELHSPDGYFKLRGYPARVLRAGQTVEGNTIEMSQPQDGIYNMIAEQGANLEMVTDRGTFMVESRKMDFQGKQRLLTFENVVRAVIPERGELSGGLLEAYLTKENDHLRLERIHMTRDVMYKGNRFVEGEARPISCQADEMNYNVAEEVIYFHGNNRDVVFSDAQVETRNRDLKYHLKDGRFSGYSARNRSSTTTVPLSKPNPRIKE